LQATWPAIRIGVNHGSLSDRIMSRYGDTAMGMVESAMEFLHIFQKEDFHQVVLSLKASNTRIMVQAYRLLVNKMMVQGMNYPLHLGVTEAGDGEDGRIKSAVGMGTLLADGIGDTIRVSLTEDPEAELPVAKKLVNNFLFRTESNKILKVNSNLKNPFEYSRFETVAVNKIGGKNQPVVIADWCGVDKWNLDKSLISPDFYFLQSDKGIHELPGNLNYLLNFKTWFSHRDRKNVFPVYTDAEFAFYGEKSDSLNFIIAESRDLSDKFFDALTEAKRSVIILETYNLNGVADQRSFFYQMLEMGISVPIIINRNYCEDKAENLQLKSAADIGALLIDGFGDGVWLRNSGPIPCSDIVSNAFGILQASRVRMSKTEYISCPSCGRTLFDLQATTAKIKERTNHLKHLKIGIMGCIVNGPGEMADADYGYVGAGPGNVTLYKGKEVVKKGLPTEKAVDELIQLIKDNGDWIEKQ
jgi:(E)-4-hydroxy-3-methylbut-2-enyl-diphosphate synthase